MKIAANSSIPYIKGAVEAEAEVNYWSANSLSAEAIKGADVLIVRSIDKCTPSLLQGSGVKLITTATIGFDHIDTSFCDKAGILWKNAPGCNSTSVAQYVANALLSVSMAKGESLKGKTIGIVGVGHVGEKVKQIAQALGMRTLLNDPPREEKEATSSAHTNAQDTFVSLDLIAEEADIITFHTPLTRNEPHATFHLANEDFFKKLKRKPWIVNAARGAIHDTAALLSAKKQGNVGELIIDCWEKEPHISEELLKMSAIATPHIAGFSADGKANATRMCLQTIEKHFNMHFQNIGNIQPPPPPCSQIDLSLFPKDNRIPHAMLHCFDPKKVDDKLRRDPFRFEDLRNNYDHPREFSAYKLLNATSEELALWNKVISLRAKN